MKQIASLKGVSKSYKTGDTTIIALQTTDISINTGELTLVVGPSGSGKTTLISIIGGVLYPSEGEVYLDNKKISEMNETELAHQRLQHIGFVFQGFNLLAPLTALENVMHPLILKGVKRKVAKNQAKELLTELGLANRMNNLPKELSGGQQQRVAIARALISNPEIILCDEPTAALDHESAKKVMDTLQILSHQDKAVVVVTHDMRLKEYADRTIDVIEGKISSDTSDNSNKN
ncbi:ABC transporter ATP-binding protein [Porphyromonas pogonae]|uniref:ABC transporter ATP-binding protein n=1 Tax=Porphyromonas pogonae TaxID=867595 RepID=UPI002E77CAF7|nr:ABC transporter ATP-binding protein [Porphyromonas pogonae]